MTRWLPFVSSVILGLAFFDERLSWLVAVGLLPLIVFWQQPKISKRTKTLLTWLAGFVFYAIVSSWIVFTEPSRWTTLGPEVGKLMAAISWLLSALVWSSGWAVFAWLNSHYKLMDKRLNAWLLVPAAWVVGEYLRSWAFSIFWLGP